MCAVFMINIVAFNCQHITERESCFKQSDIKSIIFLLLLKHDIKSFKRFCQKIFITP